MATLSIDPSITPKLITYGIQSYSRPEAFTLDPSEVSISPSSLECPIELDVVDTKGADFDTSIFSFDHDYNSLLIYSKDREKEGRYQMKVIARIASDNFQQAAEHSFDIFLVDRCKQELRGQKSTEVYEKFYTYSNTAI